MYGSRAVHFWGFLGSPTNFGVPPSYSRYNMPLSEPETWSKRSKNMIPLKFHHNIKLNGRETHKNVLQRHWQHFHDVWKTFRKHSNITVSVNCKNMDVRNPNSTLRAGWSVKWGRSLWGAFLNGVFGTIGPPQAENFGDIYLFLKGNVSFWRSKSLLKWRKTTPEGSKNAQNFPGA